MKTTLDILKNPATAGVLLGPVFMLCQLMAESQAPELEPAGNWGPATNGLQLCLRVSKLKAGDNEPLLLAISLRNQATNAISIRKPPGWDWAVARDRRDSLKPDHTPKMQVDLHGPSSYLLEPRCQIKWNYQWWEPLPPGTNFLVVGTRLHVNGTNFMILDSGVAEVVVPPPVAPPATNTNSQR
jgi:hypothetical protein